MNPEPAKMEIPNPRRILAVALADSAQHLSDVIKDLTGTHPPTQRPPSPSEDEEEKRENTGEQTQTQTAETLAGTTHPLTLSTPYYTATVPIWLDLVAGLSSPAEWAASFLSPEAREVLEVIGGVVVVFGLPSNSTSSSSSYSSSSSPPSAAAAAEGGATGSGGAPGAAVPSSTPENERERAKELIRQVGRVVREGLGGWEWDGAGLAVGIGQVAGDDGDGGELDEWEDLCAEWGLEFVHVPRAGVGSGKGKKGDERNEFGERMGIARVLEALEANDWSGGGMGGEGEEEEADVKEQGQPGEDEDDEFDPEKLDFGFDREDFLGLKRAIWSGGEKGGDDEDEEVGEEDVQKLERMMMKLQAVRDASAGMPEEQRKRMAARAVGEVMKEL
ncbi:alpha and gamma adaptin binding protein p34-domain-containing protein [Parachaetomium inaequale]|uniref:Alpha and gamma adaptin binding protein p34-domain-containing protein n=1 Tax=Parachaetomium inaequale TaxID=2588326 RepID=A0AAN6SRL3_9PEZI|nr:alpha and gamma adaptin binding protein p34-domain-containing protein [Parachaetomium inaequale]